MEDPVARAACLMCLVLLAASAAGCVELSRRDMHRPTEIIGDGVRVRKPAVAATVPRTDGLKGTRYSEIEGFYRVAKTDSLVSIAQKFYGDRSFVREIQERNRDILASSGCTRGVVLVLPKVERQARRQEQPVDTTDPVAAASAALDEAQFGRQRGMDRPLPDFTDLLPPNVGAQETPAAAEAAPGSTIAPEKPQDSEAETKKK